MRRGGGSRGRSRGGSGGGSRGGFGGSHGGFSGGSSGRGRSHRSSNRHYNPPTHSSGYYPPHRSYPRTHYRRVHRYNRRYYDEPYSQRRDYWYYNNRNQDFFEGDQLATVVGVGIVIIVLLIFMSMF